ncbi:MAG: hypothetical protein FJ271_01735 [Planctomycetes bacterium]|nr:hypothetical protein [Planctomycetota bacterium]
MRLHVGERLSGSGAGDQPGGYLVTGVVCETAWSGLYSGKKVLYNFDFTSKRPRETDDKEWLDVLIRTIQYSHADDAEYVAGRRAMARAEARGILGGRHSRLWPEPVDFFEIANSRDSLAVNAAEREPVIVLAHPHGLRLDEWQKQVLPLASLLSVLAESLEFLRQAHERGLVINSLTPAAMYVDRTNRVHFVGTDMVLTPPGSAAGLPVWPVDAPFADGVRERWQKFFPPPRYAPGFAAPECVTSSRLPDVRSDFFSWGCLGYYLLTGEDPGKIAAVQGRGWANLEREHYAAMERSLRSVPPSHARNWAEQLGVPSDALVHGWPGNVLGLFRQLLHWDARRRPGSVAELRAWLVAPPTAPVAAAVAVRAPGGVAKVLIDAGEAAGDLDIVVRRASGARLDTTIPQDEIIYDGPLTSIIDDAGAPGEGDVSYSICTRKRPAVAASPSVPTHGELLRPDRDSLLRWLQGQSRANQVDAPEPACLELLYQVLDYAELSETLLASALPAVRGWAIQRLTAIQPLTARSAPADALLWRALADPLPQLRLAAARGLLNDAGPPGDARVRRVAEALGRGRIDDAIAAAFSLKQIGVDDLQIQRTVNAFEGDRPSTCPVCRIELTGRDRPEHLRAAHGYIDVFGALLPRDVALDRLWDRVFTSADAQAHAQLLELAGADEDRAQRYCAFLEMAVRARFAVPAGQREIAESLTPFDGLVSCLGRTVDASLFAGLLRCSDSRLRQIGRKLMLPALTAAIRGSKLSVADLRLLLDKLVPDDLLEEKILLCLHLPGLGLEEAMAHACLVELQQERPVFCSECRTRIRLIDLETHLRRAHGIFEYRGVRRPFAEMRALLLERICTASPDTSAWRTLAEIARDRHPQEADARLLHWLGQKLRDVPRDARSGMIAGLGEVLAGSGDGGRLIPALLRPHKLPGIQALQRWLALEIAARLRPPIDVLLMEAVLPLLSDKYVPREARLSATAALIRAVGKNGPEARRVLQAAVAGAGKLRAIEKLRQLEQLVGQAAEIDRLSAELEDQVRMDCPRCGVQLRRAQMVDHLWDCHRLMLDGRRVREPWRLMEDWLEDYRLEKDLSVLERCQSLAHKLDPGTGGRRLQRLMLRHGIEDRQALSSLLERAREKHASLCPHCYGRVPCVPPPPEPELTQSDDALEGFGYRLEVSDAGLFPRLRIESDDEVLYDGREPGRVLTRNGALALFIGPIVLAGFLVAELLSGGRLPIAAALVLATGLGLLLSGLIYLAWPAPDMAADRLVNWAWLRLASELFPDRPGPAEADYLAGLARISHDHGDRMQRAAPLEHCREIVDRMARDNAAYVPHLAALWRLSAEDEIYRGDDPCRAIAEQVGRCFAGRMPLTYAGLLLQDLASRAAENSPTWTRGQLNRLKIMLCDRAFAAGVQLPTLVDLGLVVPALKKLLATDDLEGLAQLHYLWLMQANGPWERIGRAVSAFELAATPKVGGRALDAYPDLLLAVEGAPLTLCQRGVWFQDVLFTVMPATIEVLSRRNQQRGGYELVIGTERFWFEDSPENYARLLEKWFRYFFKDFVVQAGADTGYRSAEGIRNLLARNGVSCPECKTVILPRPGEIGITADEKIVATWI